MLPLLEESNGDIHTSVNIKEMPPKVAGVGSQIIVTRTRTFFTPQFILVVSQSIADINEQENFLMLFHEKCANITNVKGFNYQKYSKLCANELSKYFTNTVLIVGINGAILETPTSKTMTHSKLN